VHKIGINIYAGAPAEAAAYVTHVAGGGAVNVTVDGASTASAGGFPLKKNPGDQTELRITLFGANGDSCVVGVSVVDGGTDADLLVCQPHDPAPSHKYIFIVAAAASLHKLTEFKQGGGR
jgi:hypothetical protein